MTGPLVAYQVHVPGSSNPSVFGCCVTTDPDGFLVLPDLRPPRSGVSLR